MAEASKRRRKSYSSTPSGFVLFVESVTFGSHWPTFHLRSLRHCSHVGECPSVRLYHPFVCLLCCSHEFNSKMAFRKKQHVCSSFSTLQFKGSVPPVFPYLPILLLTALLHRSLRRQLLDSWLLFCAANYWQDCVPVWTLSDVGLRLCVMGHAG